MSSTIFTAPEYDPRRDRRRRSVIVIIIAALVLIGALVYRYRNFPYERVVDRFFAALHAKDYERAYGIWVADPNWKQHPQQFDRYSYYEFYRDWGPGGEWGVINQYHVEGAERPRGGGSGVVVEITVNQRAEKARIWVEKSDKSLTFSPY